tara:strand:- start:920 stop:1606 length:687 start_codon:yes stop_codon:yes gene_type:complete
VRSFFKNKFWLISAPRYAVLYFILSVFTAGFFYVTGEYSIKNNFLSQLGQLYVFKNLNIISFLIFNISLIIMGLVLSMFYINFFHLFKLELKNNFVLKLLLIFGVTSGICFSGVGIFPTDIAFKYHIFFADTAFYSLLVVSLVQTYIIFKSDFLSNQYSMGYLIFCIFLAFYVRLLIFGGDPSIGMPEGYYQSNHVLSQKLIVFTILIATLHQTVGIKKFLNNNEINY